MTESSRMLLADEQAHLQDSNLATKGDIREVKLELELKIELVRSEVQKARVGLARWMLTGWVAQSGLLATLFWYFSSGPPGG